MSDNAKKIDKKSAKKSSKNTRIRWEKLEIEYISSKISYKDLAKKHKISERQVQRYASANNWQEKRRDYVAELSGSVRNAIIQNETIEVVGKLKNIATAADKLCEYVLKATQDDEQLYTRSFYDSERNKVVEYKTNKIDGGTLNQLVRALDKLTDIIRDVNQITDERRNKQDVEAKIILPEGVEKYGK